MRIERNVFGITDAIYSHLSAACESCTLRWKRTDSTEADAYAEVKPEVYEYTYDGEEIPDGPSVLIQTTRISPDSIHYVVYVSCCHPAVQECEMADPVEGETNSYEYRTDEVDNESVPAKGFSSDGVRRELYRVTLMLADYVFTSLMRMSMDSMRMQGLSLIPPSAYMQEFPYCSASIEFDALYLSKPAAMVGTELSDLL